jgi:drug/metabolite transporter (DMT)-like permease
VALVWLGERPRPIELIGGAIGIAGVVVINRWRHTGEVAAPITTLGRTEVAT